MGTHRIMISGTTRLILHAGYPIAQARSPLIYNPYFAQHGIDAAVVALDAPPASYPELLRAALAVHNVAGMIVTMPHKRTTCALVDERSVAAGIAGACNAVVRMPDGRLRGDLFDGIGFVRGLARNGIAAAGRRCLVVGAGGVGSAIAAALTDAGAAALRVSDIDAHAAAALTARIAAHFPAAAIDAGPSDPAGFDLVVNATPLGMNPDDPLPFDVARLEPTAVVADVVMKGDVTPVLAAAAARGCRIQLARDMLYEQIPLYFALFGFGPVTADEMRRFA
jgi:shikimate dehydrogenase